MLVGLGNPGSRYQSTRHNIGFMFLDFLLKSKSKDSFKVDPQYNAEIARVRINDCDCMLVKPLTFMNLSGEAVAKVARFYKIATSQIIVFYDDLDLASGKLRLRTKSGDGGHNGIKSIKQHLATNDYINFRFGIGRPENSGFEISDWVLSKLSKSEQETFQETFSLAEKTLGDLLSGGLSVAQNRLAERSSE